MDVLLDNVLTYDKNNGDDYYSILGCDESSSAEQIATEYKLRAMSCHPDKHPDDKNAHERFSQLSRAKSVLLDPVERKDYDKWRNSGIAIPFDRWKSMSCVKTSMHWGVPKQQKALDMEQVDTPNHSNSPANMQPLYTPASSLHIDSGNCDSQSFIPFIPRDPSKRHGAPPNWERDTSNPLLQKFRNYQI